jgi:mRNA interferase HigB
VRVISKKRLRGFWKGRKADTALAERDLSAWYKLASSAAWGNFSALKQTFGSADQVGDCVAFDVGNNRFRLIGRVRYATGILYVLKVMDHKEYDRRNWVDECGCHRPPPKRTAGRQPPRGKKKRG